MVMPMPRGIHLKGLTLAETIPQWRAVLGPGAVLMDPVMTRLKTIAPRLLLLAGAAMGLSASLATFAEVLGRVGWRLYSVISASGCAVLGAAVKALAGEKLTAPATAKFWEGSSCP
jgi:hypothetical protein